MRINITNADSLAVCSTADRTISQLSRAGLPSEYRLNPASAKAPSAPIAPPCVGVASPMKIVPSTRKIKNNGGTITNVTRSANRDSNLCPSIGSSIRLAKATGNAAPTVSAIVRTTRSGPASPLLRNANIANAAAPSISTSRDSSPRDPSVSLSAIASRGNPGAASGRTSVTTNTNSA